jgi:hypothetical protein
MSRIGAIEENGLAVLRRSFPTEYLDCVLEQINRLSPRRSRAGVRRALGLAPVEELARQSSPAGTGGRGLRSGCVPLSRDPLRQVTGGELACCSASGHRPAVAVSPGNSGLGAMSIKEGIDYAHAPAAALCQVLALRVSFDHSTVERASRRFATNAHAGSAKR